MEQDQNSSRRYTSIEVYDYGKPITEEGSKARGRLFQGIEDGGDDRPKEKRW